MDKEDVIDTQIYIHTHTHTVEYYSAINKNEIIAICNNTDGLGGYHAK